MKRIRKSRAARVVSWLLTAAMIVPLAGELIRPRAAFAQTAVVGGGIQTVIVVDFVNKSNFLGEALARRATDAVAVELANSARFEVLRRDEVDREAAKLGLKKPYDIVAQAKLAGAFGAIAVVTGEIVTVKSAGKPGDKTVYGALRVRLREPGSVDAINGAAQVGEAKARPGQMDDESLAQEAIDSAALLSVRQILSTNLAEGTIVSTVGDQSNLQILINRGSRDGVASGHEMIVTRERQRVGKIRITNVFAADSEAKVVQNTLGIRPEDKVRAIFPDPAFPTLPKVGKVAGGGGRPSSGSSMGSLGKILVIVAAGVLISAAVMGGKNSSVTGVVAEADSEAGNPTVRVTWRDNFFGSSTLEHHVWRVPEVPYNFQAPPCGAIQFVNNYTDYAAPWSFWDGVRGYLRAPLPGTGGTGGNTGGQASTETPAAAAVLGFTPGTTYSYLVTGIVRTTAGQANTGGGQGGGGGGGQNSYNDVETEPVASAPVTPITPPLLGPVPADQSSNIDITRFSPTWMSRRGADVFQLEVSTDRAFRNRTVILQLPMVYSTAALADGVTQSLGSAVDLTTNPVLLKDRVFADFVNRVAGAIKPTLFWRVGGRNSGDRPGPVNWMSRSHTDGDKTFRFVYSAIRSFTPADMPPPPP